MALEWMRGGGSGIFLLFRIFPKSVRLLRGGHREVCVMQIPAILPDVLGSCGRDGSAVCYNDSSPERDGRAHGLWTGWVCMWRRQHGLWSSWHTVQEGPTGSSCLGGCAVRSVGCWLQLFTRYFQLAVHLLST